MNLNICKGNVVAVVVGTGEWTHKRLTYFPDLFISIPKFFNLLILKII